MNQELVKRLRELAKEVEQSEDAILFVSLDQTVLIESVNAIVQGGTVPYKDIGALLYYIADMAED